MRIAMEEVARKLTLWHTPTFRPLYTHDDLDPIMAAAGFLPLPPVSPGTGGGGRVAWREYQFGGRSGGAGKTSGRRRQQQHHRHHKRKEEEECPCPCPRPRLPYPRIDGLHLFAYEAFFDALDYYLGPHRVPDLFHVRSMPLTRSQDLLDVGAYRHMRDCNMEDEGIYVFRDGTLDHRTNAMDCTSNGMIKPTPTKANTDTATTTTLSSTCLVPLEDLFPSTSRDIVSLG
ncbi:uncharacterized protein M6B38_204385 [Iris pallida]|uniref:Uncharacterized protein n=1 Tax=Iris pallida TaxID=29817 RepID=A0AAX6E7L0_IRIPA|nr:Uncharacterized protein M6B38_223800 [Iris pallida]KAJ6799951.1 uncharacterized protein M6B38_204385 [Iris pallida]